MITTRIINFFKKTAAGDFILLMTAPIDSPAIKSVREESEKIGREQNFSKYVFGNIILGQKN